MNNKGIWGYAIMLSMTLLVLVLALAPAVKTFTDDAMSNSTSDSIGLNCTDDAQSNFVKGTCVITDFSQAYFIGGLILIALAIITARIIF